jgi:bifunctional UDP-N-acetylglucosamine pyrophosphorylase/glucosamine-1-phosphate N-acetyltransferase
VLYRSVGAEISIWGGIFEHISRMSTPTHIVILAAGQGTRMKSTVPKVLHPIAGRPMIERVLATANAVGPASISVVVGHAADLVRDRLSAWRDIQFAVQMPQLGTAHALQQTEPLLAGREGTLVLLSGDVPLLQPDTLRQLLDAHRAAAAVATVMTAVVERPYGYGRIVRSQGRLARIVEERDATPAERQIKEINAGIYAFELAPLFDALRGIAAQNVQGEYYLTDLIAIYHRRKLPIETMTATSPVEIRGINSRTELAEVSRLVRQKKNEELMAAGVTIVDPATTYIDPEVEIGPDTVIHPGVVLEGRTRIGSMCEIQAHVRIADSQLGDRVRINNFCLLTNVRVGANASIGPFAHLRARDHARRGCPHRQLRGAEEDDTRRRDEGEPSRIPGRRVGRRGRQYRRGNNHLQLRRSEEGTDHHRGWRLRRQ